MKKLIALLLVVFVIVSIFAGCTSKEAAAPEKEAAAPEKEAAAPEKEAAPSAEVVKIGVTFPYDLDALPWLVDACNWIKDWDAANDNVEVQLAGAPDANQYEPTLRSFAEDGCSMIVCAFNNFTDATTLVSADYPDVKFFSFEGRFNDIESFSNLVELRECKDYQFLSGACAAMVSKNQKIALISGADIAACQEINASWAHGARYINPDIDFDVVVVNTYEDPTVGYETAISLMKDGYDVLCASAGGTEEGILQALDEYKDQYGAYYVADAADYSDSYPDIEICACVQNNGKLITMFLDKALNGEYPAGQCIRGLASDGVSEFVLPETSPVTDEMRAQLEEIETKLVSGEIKFDLVLPE